MGRHAVMGHGAPRVIGRSGLREPHVTRVAGQLAALQTAMTAGGFTGTASAAGLNVSRAEREFGFRATTAFDEGLQETIEWYRGHRHVWEKQLWMREIPIITGSGKAELH